MNKKIIIPPENQRLRDFRIRSAKGQNEIADTLGITKAGISNIETGRAKLTRSNILTLSRVYNLNPDWLLYGYNPKFLDKPEPEVSLIPVIADIPAGPWEFWLDSYAPGAGDDYLAVPPDMRGKNLFAVRVDGDSMEPVLFDGDILIIDPHKKYRHGLAVVRHHWGYKIRNVYKQNERRYYLCPQNSKYESEEITADNETRIYVPVKVISMRDI